jgi:hypothetical protein
VNKLNLNVGARVYCHDGKCGRLAYLVVEPQRRQVTHIIVEQGFLQKHFRLLPISIVEQATTGDVYLKVGDEELATFPEYQPVPVDVMMVRGEETFVGEPLPI